MNISGFIHCFFRSTRKFTTPYIIDYMGGKIKVIFQKNRAKLYLHRDFFAIAFLALQQDGYARPAVRLCSPHTPAGSAEKIKWRSIF